MDAIFPTKPTPEEPTEEEVYLDELYAQMEQQTGETGHTTELLAYPDEAAAEVSDADEPAMALLMALGFMTGLLIAWLIVKGFDG